MRNRIRIDAAAPRRRRPAARRRTARRGPGQHRLGGLCGARHRGHSRDRRQCALGRRIRDRRGDGAAARRLFAAPPRLPAEAGRARRSHPGASSAGKLWGWSASATSGSAPGNWRAHWACGSSVTTARLPAAAPLWAEQQAEARGLDDVAARRRCGFAARAVDGGDARASGRGRTRPHEARRHPGQHRARRHRRRGALAEALRAGRLGGAALDVFATEPLPAGSALADCPSLLLTPHVAGVTRESNLRVSMLVADQVAAALEGGVRSF